MKNKVVHNGRISCFCNKCYSKNVYYLQQKPVVLPISPNGHLIHNEENGKWHTLRTTREKCLMYDVAWGSSETEYLSLICRDCGNSEQIIDD